MKPPILAIDTRDDRREIVTLLDKLPPRVRVRFVAWCCSRVRDFYGNGPTPMFDPVLVDQAYRDDAADRRITNGCYSDILVMGSQWRLDLVAAAIELEKWVKRPADRPRPPFASPSFAS